MVARKLCAAGIAAAALCEAVCVQAATQVVPSFRVLSHAEENARLLSDGAVTETAQSVVLDASLNVSAFNERSFITLEPRVLVNTYSNSANSDLEGNDTFLQTRAEHSWQTVTIGFRSDYRSEAIVRAELPSVQNPNFEDDIGVDNPDSVDSGRLIFFDQKRKRLSLRPYVEFDISERSRMHFQTDYTDVGYTGNDLFIRTGYTARSVRASVIRRANERNRVTATLLARNYRADGTGNDTNSVGIVGQVSRQITDLWTLNLEAGVERSDYRFEDELGFVIDNAAVEYLYGVRARHRGERTQIEFSLDHRQDGSASGFVVDRDQLRIYVNHDITQRLSTRIGARIENYSGLGSASKADDRDYRRAEFSMSWALQPKWSLTGGYNYTAQDFVNDFGGSRSSHGIYIGIAYQGLSRPGTP